ncbi:hypothetical protein [Chitinophaga solisilvae]|uniref:Uncharacterized protein n=1 Tax=Chitinophaga solisilvae TaxID=1233460 RepID=A0A3S1BNE2_9BACT|nr:hypothetical protein [Chitinophaga solisilvae]NSL86623.1 hypothetical protein [Chitinophaga solisilvae]
MEKHNITVMIKGKPYGLTITINRAAFETVYEVIPNVSDHVLQDFQPNSNTFTIDHTDTVEGSIRTVEGEQIARIIWLEILNKME